MYYLWITFLVAGGVLDYNDYNAMEYIHTSKIIKTGTSLCIVIPKAYLVAMDLQRGDQMVLTVPNGKGIFLQKLTPSLVLELKHVYALNDDTTAEKIIKI